MPRVLVALCGLGSDNARLKALAYDCLERCPGLQSDVFPREQPSLWEARDPYVRELAVRRVYYYLRDVAFQYRDYEITVASHSFGAYALGRALDEGVPNLRLQRVALFGSILAEDYDWDRLVQDGVVFFHQVLNFARPLDWTVALGGLIEGGYSGNLGFACATVCNLFKGGGHGSYYPFDTGEVAELIQGNFQSWKSNHPQSLLDWYEKQSPIGGAALVGLEIIRHSTRTSRRAIAVAIAMFGAVVLFNTWRRRAA